MMYITALFCALFCMLVFVACDVLADTGFIGNGGTQTEQPGGQTPGGTQTEQPGGQTPGGSQTEQPGGQTPGGSQTEQPGEGTEGLQYQKRKDADGKEYAAVVGLGMAWETDIVIPSVYRDLPVKEIGGAAFSTGTDARPAALTSISIPNSVTAIGDSAFQGCSGLTEITIPNSVTAIRDRAFDRVRDTAKKQKNLLKQSLSRA